jgi:hypothetical protein
MTPKFGLHHRWIHPSLRDEAELIYLIQKLTTFYASEKIFRSKGNIFSEVAHFSRH